MAFMTEQKRQQHLREMLAGVKATGAEEVHVDAGQVIAILGIELVEKLATALVHMTQVTEINRPRRASLKDNGNQEGGIATFNREELLAALEAVNAAENPTDE